MNAGRSLELHFVDGNPEGMLTAAFGGLRFADLSRPSMAPQ